MKADNTYNTNCGVQLTTLDSLGKKVFVISDLHMAAGRKENGNFDGTENFYADASFVRFLDALQQQLTSRRGLLIINGDFIDFLRICTVPKEKDLPGWQHMLQQAGITKTVEELRNAVSDKERKYGLKTHDYKSVWKLHVCIRGHRAFFRRLAQWLADGNELVVIKGNHDLEWQWPAVQTYLCAALQELAADEKQPQAMGNDLARNIRFVQDALLLDGRIYIVHGQQFEKVTAVIGAPTINNGTELNLPFGSFLNRYLINNLELSYPFLDNVRPTQNILKILLKENFPKALRVVSADLPYTISMIPKDYSRLKLYYLVPFFLLTVFPVLAAIGAAVVIGINGGWRHASFGQIIGNVLLCLSFLLLSYFLGKLLVHVEFPGDPKFSEEGRRLLRENPAVEAVLLGHTHDPEQNNFFEAADGSSGGSRPNQWYFNTGTWIPVFETSSSSVRFDKTYTFIAIDPLETPPCRERLQRWNDDAGRIDTMVLNDKI